MLFLLLSSTLLLLLPECLGEERVVDLQELLLNVSDSYRDFGNDLKELEYRAAEHEKHFDEKFKQTNERLDQVEAHLKHADQTGIFKVIEENNRRMLENFNEHKTMFEEGLKKIKTSLAEKAKNGSSVMAEDCSDLYRAGIRQNGVYSVLPLGVDKEFQVYCDMKTDGGGWTVFQRRGDYGTPQDFFYKTWDEYKHGFGDLRKEFWLGNDRIFALSHQRSYMLHVDLWDMDGDYRHARYSRFRMQNEDLLYRLNVGGYTGNAGDSLSSHNGQAFSTKDKDNDGQPRRNCATIRDGAWWYVDDTCTICNLNGLNLKGPNQTREGITWDNWRGWSYSLAFVQLKVRPENF